jgi:anti-sigma regulatory factor (Ser/Thr protein kinase)
VTAIVLPGVPASVGEARLLAYRELSGGQADAAALVLSELATNAIEHSRSGLPGGTFTVSVETGRGGRATIRVADQGPRPGDGADDRPADEHGRGLVIVAEVADMWGTETTAAGRVAWCLLGGGPAGRSSNAGVHMHPGTRAPGHAREGAPA